jgi:ribosomal protein S19
MTSAGSIVTVTAPGRAELSATAQSTGEWSVQVDLRRGQNRFQISARNPDTGKEAETPREVVITVPFLEFQAPTLVISNPVEGTTYGNGAIAVEGTTTNAVSVTVTSTFLGAATGAPGPAPSAMPSPGPSGSPAPLAGTTVQVADDGSYSLPPLDLTAGRWSITVTATSQEGKTASLTRTVTVAYEGVNLVVSIHGGPAWIKVWVDGKLVGSQAGQVYQAGKTLTFSGKTSVEVRTGSSGSTRFTLNGVSLGSLGKAGIPETWLFAPPANPVKTQRA